MLIEVRLFASLRSYLPKGSNSSCKIEIEEGSRIEDIFHILNIPIDYPKIILINAVHVSLENHLKEGDVITVFPPIAGG